MIINMNETSIENQRIFVASRTDFRWVGGWVLHNSYGVRI